MNSLFTMNEQKWLSYRMQLFAHVVRYSSITKAAEHLELTKSGLSQHITDLESFLDTQLLQRTTRRLQLTEAGELFYQHCCNIENTISRAVEELQQSKHQLSGKLTITAPQALAESTVIPVIAQLKQENPDLKINLLLEDQQIDLLHHQIDLAIRVGAMKDSSLKSRRIGSFKEYYYSSPTLIKSECSTKKEINSYPQIHLPWQNAMQGDRAIQVNNLSGATQLAIQGAGVTLLPEIYAKHYCDTKQLNKVFRKSPSDSVPIYSVHSYHQTIPKKVERTISLIQERLKAITS